MRTAQSAEVSQLLGLLGFIGLTKKLNKLNKPSKPKLCAMTDFVDESLLHWLYHWNFGVMGTSGEVAGDT
jgi:hypothetical protein